jgi:hypothetical protein
MTVYSEKRYPVWFIVVVSITTLLITLYAVRPINSLVLPKDGTYIGSLSMSGLDEAPFLAEIDRSKNILQMTFFHRDISPQKNDLVVTPSLFGTSFKPPRILIFGKEYNFTGNSVSQDDAKGYLSSDRGQSVGHWYLRKVAYLPTVSKDTASSYVTTWKQSQELLKLKTKENHEYALLKTDQQKLKEILAQQSAIQVEGGRKLARARRELDEKSLAKKKTTAELSVLRGRIILAQKLSPQGKFLALSRISLKEEASWFFQGAKK